MACECVLAFGGFGAMPFGTGPYGLGYESDPLAIAGATLITANLALVAYTGDPGLPNPGNTRGPLFPNNWHLVALDPGLVVRLAQHVVIVPDEATRLTLSDDQPQIALYPLPFFLVWFDGPLTPGGHYELDLTLDPPIPSGCSCSELVGLTLRRDTHQTDARDGERLMDVANPAVPRDALRLPPLLGTYQLTDAGDFGLDKSEASSLRKRVIRRVTTVAGGFFHLPGYGAMPKLKGLLTVDAAERLQARILAQVRQEPDVVDASVTVQQVPGFPGMLSVGVNVVPLGGEPFGLAVPIQIP